MRLRRLATISIALIVATVPLDAQRSAAVDTARLHKRLSPTYWLAFAGDRLFFTAGGFPDNDGRLFSVTGSAPGELRSLVGRGPATVTPDGKRAVLSGRRVTSRGGVYRSVDVLYVWSDTAASEREIPLPAAPRYVAVDPSGAAAAVALETDTVKLVDLSTGRMQHVTANPDPARRWQPVLGFAPKGDLLAVAASNGTLVWDVARRRDVRRLDTGVWGQCVAFSPDGRRLAVGTFDGEVQLWEVTTGLRIKRFRLTPRVSSGHFAINGIAFSADGTTLAAAGSDGAIRLWDSRDWEARQPLVGGGDLQGIAFSPRGPLLAAAGGGAVWLWDVRRERPIARLLFEADSLAWAAVNADSAVDGEWLAAAIASALAPDTAAAAWIAASARGMSRDTASRAVLVVQTGHREPIGELAFSPDGRLLASAEARMGQPAAVKLWDVSTGLEVRWLLGLTGATTALAFSPDGKQLAGVASQTLVWDVVTGNRLHLYNENLEAIGPVAFQRDGSLLGVGVGAVARWETQTGQRLAESPRFPEGAVSKQLSASGAYVTYWTAREGGNVVHVLDVARGAVTATLRGHKSLVVGSAFSRDDKLLATCDQDGFVKVWALPSGQPVASLLLPMYLPSHGLRETCNALAFDRSALRLAIAATKSLHLWNVAERRIERLLADTAREVAEGFTAVAFSPDGRSLVAGARDGTLTYWDLEAGVQTRAVRPMANSVEFATFGQDQNRLVTVANHLIARWDLRAGKIDHTVDRARGPWSGSTSRVATSADRRRLAVVAVLAVGYRPVFVFDLTADSTRDSTSAVDWMASDAVDLSRYRLSWPLALSGDGALLATTFDGATKEVTDGRIGVWRAATGEALHTLVIPKSRMNAVAFSPDARLVVAAADSFGLADDHGSTVVAWDLASGAVVSSRVVGDRIARAVGFTPAGRIQVVSGSEPLRVWDARTGDSVATLRAADAAAGGATAIAFSPDGALLAASYSGDALIRIWDLETSTVRRVLRGHQSFARSLAFSADGTRLVSAGTDGTTRLWNVATGDEIVSIVPVGQRDFVIAAPSNHYLATRAGARGVGFRVGTSAYPFEQFDLRLNRPDLVLQQLGTADSSLVAAFREAHEKRLARAGLTDAMLGDDFHLPEVRLETRSLPLSTPTRVLQLRVHAADSLYDLERLHLFVNNVPVFGSAGMKLQSTGVTRTWDGTIPITLSAGVNKIQLSAVNTRGAESMQATATVTYTGRAEGSDLYVMVVGVSHYAESRYDLTFAAKDARDLAQLFAEQGRRSGHFAHVYVDTILDVLATRERILALRERLSRTKEDDEVVLFFAGHGLLDRRFTYYFGTSDVSFAAPGERGMTYDEIEGLLDGIPARRKLLLMDTCHAGELDRTEAERAEQSGARGADTSRPQAQAARVHVRALPAPRGIGTDVRLVRRATTLLEDVFTELRRGSGATVIAAAGGAEFALESAEWQNGVFTYAVRRGLEARGADANGDGVVRVSELREFVANQVEALTQGRQRPVARRENVAVDFVVY